ncbi:MULTISPECIES: DUF1481 domain-containing protein [unclassified Dickeya]|uniref:DUF1481 domain-containing protein n=1 Tax=unclassified Dickeya TaxID=2622466 RepID=UPI00055692FC|nr:MULTISPECIES: DUF1481 domain-containing protein [unclassified Dickeya]
MLTAGLSRGAISPLLLFYRRCRCLGLLALTGMQVACSSHSPLPAVFASGYLADRGVVRLWRQDEPQQQLTTLVTVFTPLEGDEIRITRYHFQQGVLREVAEKRTTSPREEVRLRFDQAGTVSYMQRQLPQRRESLSEDDIALYQFDARQRLALSDSLRAGHVLLRQGHWQAGQVTTCEGQSVRPDWDGSAQRWINQQAAQAKGALGIAWLSSPQGTQLLQMAEEDFCRFEPFKEGE